MDSSCKFEQDEVFKVNFFPVILENNLPVSKWYFWPKLLVFFTS